jgi:hypothetical protein
MKKVLFIHHHTGLGDHFNCSGMVRYLANQPEYSKCFVVAKQKYLHIVQHMYDDDDKIEVVVIPSEPWTYETKFALEALSKIKKHNSDSEVVFYSIGHENYPWGQPILKTKNPWEIFYDQLGINYDVRTELFEWPRALKCEAAVYSKLVGDSDEPYAFVHEDKSRGLAIDRSKIGVNKIIENPTNESPFLLRKVFEEAAEIHCIDSSIKCLIDLMPADQIKGKLFLHNVREYALGALTNNWNIV